MPCWVRGLHFLLCFNFSYNIKCHFCKHERCSTLRRAFPTSLFVSSSRLMLSTREQYKKKYYIYIHTSIHQCCTSDLREEITNQMSRPGVETVEVPKKGRFNPLSGLSTSIQCVCMPPFLAPFRRWSCWWRRWSAVLRPRWARERPCAESWSASPRASCYQVGWMSVCWGKGRLFFVTSIINLFPLFRRTRLDGPVWERDYRCLEKHDASSQRGHNCQRPGTQAVLKPRTLLCFQDRNLSSCVLRAVSY